MNAPHAEFTLSGADGEVIRGSTHRRADEPRLVALLAHGFKGYKDYGFLPLLAEHLARELPVVVHRFNFSHSGIGDDPATFQRPDLFEKASRDKQVADLNALIAAADAGELPETPAGLPIVLLGHSRGGVDALVTAGRRFRDGATPALAGVVSMSAPDRSLTISDEQQAQMRELGYLPTPSARTGQELRVGLAWVEEQRADPEQFDLRALGAHVESPVLIVHGEQDPTVPASCAETLHEICRVSRLELIPECDHIFNTPNPADPEAPISPQLRSLMDAVRKFLDGLIANG